MATYDPNVTGNVDGSDSMPGKLQEKIIMGSAFCSKCSNIVGNKRTFPCGHQLCEMCSRTFDWECLMNLCPICSRSNDARDPRGRHSILNYTAGISSITEVNESLPQDVNTAHFLGVHSEAVSHYVHSDYSVNNSRNFGPIGSGRRTPHRSPSSPSSPQNFNHLNTSSNKNEYTLERCNLISNKSINGGSLHSLSVETRSCERGTLPHQSHPLLPPQSFGITQLNWATNNINAFPLKRYRCRIPNNNTNGKLHSPSLKANDFELGTQTQSCRLYHFSSSQNLGTSRLNSTNNLDNSSIEKYSCKPDITCNDELYRTASRAGTEQETFPHYSQSLSSKQIFDIDQLNSLRSITNEYPSERLEKSSNFVSNDGLHGPMRENTVTQLVKTNQYQTASDYYFANPTQISSCSHRLVEWYCTDCKRYMCSTCKDYDSNHTFESLREIRDRSIVPLKIRLKEAEMREKDCHSAINIIQKIKSSSDIQKCKVEKEIISRCQRFINAMKVRGIQLLKELNEVHEQRLENLCTVQEMYETSKVAFKNTKEELSNLESMSIDKLMNLKMPEVFDNLNIPIIKSHGGNYVSFKSDDDELDRLLSSFGKVECNGIVFNVVATGIGTKFLVLNQNTYFTLTYNDYKDKRKMTKDNIKALIRYPNGDTADVAIKDINNKAYEGSIYTSHEGYHNLEITIGGIEIMYKLTTKFKSGLDDISTVGSSTFGRGPNSESSLVRGWGICCARDGTIYVADKENHCVLMFSHELKFIKRLGERGNKDGEFDRPSGITCNENNLIIVDKDNHRVQMFTTGGDFIKKFGKLGKKNGEFNYPWDVATNSRGEIAISDSGNNRIQLFDKNGVFLAKSNLRGNSSIKTSPRGLCFDSDDTLFVSEFERGYIFRLIWNGDILSYDRDVGNYFRFYEPVNFERPQGLFISDGYIFIAEAKQQRIVIFIIEHILNNINYGEDYSYKILKMTDRTDFLPCNVTMTPDGYVVAVDNKRGIVYKFDNAHSDLF